MSEVTDDHEVAPEVVDSVEPAATVDEQSEATADNDGDEEPANTEEPRKVSKGVQKRLDELTRQRHEAERNAEHWREMAMRQSPANAAPAVVQAKPETAPQEDQFESYDDFVVAKAKFEVRQELRQEELHRAQVAQEQTFLERLAAVQDQLPDYDRLVSSNKHLPITPDMAEVIKVSEVGPQVAYYLGTNVEEAHRISALSPRLQAAEIGKIEARLSQKSAPVTPPPPPPKTVQGSISGASKDPSGMSMAEYVAWRQAGNG